MLKYLYPRVDWETVRIAGCDMDGTLYDEADFISQVYSTIANMLSATDNAKAEVLHSWMFERWLEKGSSYPHIFYEATIEAGIPREDVAKTVVLCLELFRNYQPVLTLSPRVKAILEALRARYPLFLISDGSARLQQRKFDALGLVHWFDSVNVGISGYHGPDFCKPSMKIINKISVLEAPSLPQQVLFFGDRAVDAEFAANAGFQFVQVACMHPINVS
jgi:FMN phosphatase YigB (HAD superfamily)